MKCPRCGGLMIEVDEEYAVENKCQACGHRQLVVESVPEEAEDLDDSGGETVPEQCANRTRDGRCPEDAMPESPFCRFHQSHPAPKPAETDDIRRCQGRRGRGRCKKEVVPGSAFCPFHSGALRQPIVKPVVARPEEVAPTLEESPDGLTARVVTRRGLSRDTLQDLQAKIAALSQDIARLEAERKILQQARLILCGIDV